MGWVRPGFDSRQPDTIEIEKVRAAECGPFQLRVVCYSSGQKNNSGRTSVSKVLYYKKYIPEPAGLDRAVSIWALEVGDGQMKWSGEGSDSIIAAIRDGEAEFLVGGLGRFVVVVGYGELGSDTVIYFGGSDRRLRVTCAD